MTAELKGFGSPNDTRATLLRRLPAWIGHEISTLYPGCFAFIMATGIISNAMYFTDHHVVSAALFVVSVVSFPCLCLMTLIRAIRFRDALWADLINPRLVFSFFTIVAGADVFGAGLCLRGFVGAATLMWFFALVLWFLLIYFSFGVLTFFNSASVANVVHGGWLIAIVGTESLVVLGTQIAPHLGDFAPAAFVMIHMFWGVGLGLYGIFVTLFAYRIFFFEVKPGDLTPLLWVVMGAAAISTNAGSTLILLKSSLPFLDSMRPFIDGVTLVIWAWASWWIPLLLAFDIWKYGFHRQPIGYTPMWWSFVFPLGMYALASLRLSLASDFTQLQTLSYIMVWLALAAWLATSMGLCRSSWRALYAFTPQRWA